MKRISKKTIFILGLIVFVLIGGYFLPKVFINNTEESKIDLDNNMLSFMVETTDGNYEQSQNIPLEDYIFNPESSNCDNGGKISWNMETSKIQVTTNKSDKCHAVFDKYDFTKSCKWGYENNLACDIVKKKDDTLIYHNGTIKSGDIIIDAQDYSYRYSGASNIVNNYVCLGKNNTVMGLCDDNDLYRIIGLFKNNNGRYEIKLIKNTPYEDDNAKTTTNTTSGKGYYWSGSNLNEKNTWKDSILNTTILNINYLQSLPSYIQSKIADHIYVTAGAAASGIYVFEEYQYEIKNLNQGSYATDIDKTFEGKIGLMYITDYGYSAYKEAWSAKTLFEYSDVNIKNNNWLYINDNKTIEWIITRHSPDMDYAFTISSIGAVFSYSYNVYNSILAVRPVFFLESSTILKSGDGTINNPYRIS